MDSFYAGLPGTPFILKQYFPSVTAMKEAFSLQEEYTDVFYGEYCIIDTINKSHPENGQIYRRGYSGPEYIGRVVGPSGLFCDNIRIITRNSGATAGEEYSDENGSLIPKLKVCDSESSNWITKLKDNNNPESGDNSEKNGSSESDSNNPENGSNPEEGNNDSENNSNNPEEQVLSFKDYDFKTLDTKYKQKYKIIVYDIYENVSDEESDNKYKNETIATCFAGVYDILESMQEYPNGKTVLRYSSSPDEVLSETITDSEGNKTRVPIIKSWLENVSFNSDTGQLVFTGNGCNDTLNKVFFLKLLKNVKLDPDGTIHFLYTNEGKQGEIGEIEVDDSVNQALTWIKDARLDVDKGQLQIYFNNDKISPIIVENLAIFDNYCNYRTITEPEYYFEEILLNPDGLDGFYVKMKEVNKDSFENSGYEIKTDSGVTIKDISGNISYPALTATTEKTEEYYSYEPCYTENPLEIEIKASSKKEVYTEDFYIKEGVKAGDLSDSKEISWEELKENTNVYYYDNTETGTKILKTDSKEVDKEIKAQILFNGFPLYEIDWPLENGQPIEYTKGEVTYRKISFEKVVGETAVDGETGSLTFGEDDGSFSYKFIGQERVNGQFNFVKEVVENDLGYTAVTNTKNETSLSKTQNFRTPKEFFFFDGNTPSEYSFHLFANYSYPEPLEKLIPLYEKKSDDSVEVGAYYISSDLEKIYEGVEGENPYQEITDEISDKIFCYQEKCYQIGANGEVKDFSVGEGYPFDDENEAFWKQHYPNVKKGYWKDLGKISDGLTSDLPSLLANIAYTVETPGVTSKETQDQILWG